MFLPSIAPGKTWQMTSERELNVDAGIVRLESVSRATTTFPPPNSERLAFFFTFLIPTAPHFHCRLESLVKRDPDLRLAHNQSSVVDYGLTDGIEGDRQDRHVALLRAEPS